MTIPDKCQECDHTIIGLENVHDGWGKYHLDSVVRCDCFTAQYIVGCVAAEVHCRRKGERNDT